MRGKRSVLSSKSHGRRLWQSDIDEKCSLCRDVIRAGTAMVLDMSKTAAHPSCKNIGIRRASPIETPRYLQDNPVGRTCEGCGDTITDGERVVHVETLPWHHECRLREKQRT